MVFRQVGQAESSEGCFQPIVEDELAAHPDFDLAAFLFKLTRKQPAMGGQADVYAVVPGQVLRVFGTRVVREMVRRSDSAMRTSGPMRTAIMSLVTCSPRRTPAS